MASILLLFFSPPNVSINAQLLNKGNGPIFLLLLRLTFLHLSIFYKHSKLGFTRQDHITYYVFDKQTNTCHESTSINTNIIFRTILEGKSIFFKFIRNPLKFAAKTPRRSPTSSGKKRESPKKTTLIFKTSMPNHTSRGSFSSYMSLSEDPLGTGNNECYARWTTEYLYATALL